MMKHACRHRRVTILVLILAYFLAAASVVSAATLRLSPDTGVYTAGGTFSARVLINTAGEPINAAEAQLSFNPRELSVVSVSRNSSIFNLWTEEPSYSNSTGVIRFGGGSPTGYTGSAGTIMTITFRASAAGSPKVNFTEGSVLAANGLGTNILTNMLGGTYTVQAARENPEPEYVAPPNTPAAPSITSTTHPDPSGWYAKKTAELTWNLPADVSSVRTLLDGSPGTIPTKVYDSPISNITLEDLGEGVSYFHLQFRNAEGWGRVAHYRLAVDTENPTDITISEPEEADPSSPERALLFEVTDATSPIRRYQILLDGTEAIEFIDEEETGRFVLPSLEPGDHSVVVEAFDSAGNSIVGTYTFTVDSFAAPRFTEYPSEVSTEVIPVFKGETRPRSTVTVLIEKVDGEKNEVTVTSNDDGAFVYIPDTPFSRGVYDISLRAVDENGARSELSSPVRLIAELPGYLRVGSFVVSVLSVLVPAIALIVVLIFGVWYLWHKLLVWRKKVKKEVVEARATLAEEFDGIMTQINKSVFSLKKSRKGKLTKAEEKMINEIESDVENARSRIKKEMSDIEELIK